MLRSRFFVLLVGVFLTLGIPLGAAYYPTSATPSGNKVPVANSSGQLASGWLATGTSGSGKAPVGTTPAWTPIVTSVNSATGDVSVATVTVSYPSFSVATTDQSLTSGAGTALDATNGALVVTLPSSPTAGMLAGVERYAGAAKNRTWVRGAASAPINGTFGFYSLATQYDHALFSYVDSTAGWTINRAAQIELSIPAPSPEFVMLPNATWTQSGGLVSQVKDHSGNAFDASESTNKPTYAATGINSGPALDFDGTNDILTTSTSGPLTGYTGSFWIAMVFKLDATSGTPSLASREIATTGSVDRYFRFYVEAGGNLTFRVWDSGDVNYIGKQSTSTLSTSTTYVAVCYYDSSGTPSVTMYLNNVAQTTAASSGAFTATGSSTQTLKLGHRISSAGVPTEFVNGQISAFLVGKGTLTAGQISALYTALVAL